MIPVDLQNKLGYVCKAKKGYVNDLVANVGVSCMKQFESVGFITKGHTLKSETWRKTSLADTYYRDVFGVFSFLFNQIGPYKTQPKV